MPKAIAHNWPRIQTQVNLIPEPMSARLYHVLNRCWDQIQDILHTRQESYQSHTLAPDDIGTMPCYKDTLKDKKYAVSPTCKTFAHPSLIYIKNYVVSPTCKTFACLSLIYITRDTPPVHIQDDLKKRLKKKKRNLAAKMTKVNKMDAIFLAVAGIKHKVSGTLGKCSYM